MRIADQANDVALLAAVAEGDQAALASLYDRHGGLAYGLAMRIVGEPELGEEVVQEAFLKVWRRAGSFDPDRASVVTWLVTITRNCAIDSLRREKSQPLARSVPLVRTDGSEVAMSGGEPDDPRSDGASLARDPADVVAVHERARRIRAAVDRLPPAQRTAIQLAYFGGLSHSEIAGTLGEPVGTVKTRIFHGMRKLRDLLDEAGVRGV